MHPNPSTKTNRQNSFPPTAPANRPFPHADNVPHLWWELTGMARQDDLTLIEVLTGRLMSLPFLTTWMRSPSKG